MKNIFRKGSSNKHTARAACRIISSQSNASHAQVSLFPQDHKITFPSLHVHRRLFSFCLYLSEISFPFLSSRDPLWWQWATAHTMACALWYGAEVESGGAPCGAKHNVLHVDAFFLYNLGKEVCLHITQTLSGVPDHGRHQFRAVQMVGLWKARVDA